MTRKIRILEVIDRLADGGAETLLVTFATGLDRTRFDLHVCALRPWSESQVKRHLLALGIPVTELNQRTAYDIPALLALGSYIRRHRIDIVHTHLLAADIMGRVAGFLTGRPVVSTIHNNRMDLDEEPARRQWMERLTAHWMCRRLVVVSSLLREEITAWFGLPRNKVITIANGVDTERFWRGPDFDRAAVKRELLGGEYPMVTNVARMVPQKAQNFLIQAAAIVAKTRPDVRFVMLGGGPLQADLEAQARECGVEQQVVFAGFRSDVPDVLAASEVFVLSSLWEGMPVALLEAMAAGCAAVCTDVGGVGQVLQHEQTGLLVTPGDAEALAAALLRCLDDPAYARQLATTGQEWVTREYGMRAWVRKWEVLYLHELRQKRKRPPAPAREPGTTDIPSLQ
jgi:glycosyltransferase involved in cell wall biosynthesis